MPISQLVRSARHAHGQQRLLMIGLLKDKRPLSEWLHLLYSPYSAFDQLPLTFRADSEILLRKRNRFDFSLSQFITAVTPKDQNTDRP